jgi:hypothetical protein
MIRRSFMASILAAGVAPWIVKAGVLMPVKTIFAPELRLMEIGRLDGFRFIESPKIFRQFHPGPNGDIVHTDTPFYGDDDMPPEMRRQIRSLNSLKREMERFDKLAKCGLHLT